MKKPIIRVVTATEAKNRFGDIIRGAYLREEHLIVKRDGVPVVAIVPMSDYERLLDTEDLPSDIADEVVASVKEVKARARLAEFLHSAQQALPPVPEAEADRDIAEAIKAVRAKARRDNASQ
ncbi:MAG: type II toxin-antitoxin system Phd/YefM family antitoxin [Chloroflexota bacterium]|nr:type II toxin-antitoxin system Phd/YefM family antitoxin [Chloroflexota bacterium]